MRSSLPTHACATCERRASSCWLPFQGINQRSNLIQAKSDHHQGPLRPPTVPHHVDAQRSPTPAGLFVSGNAIPTRALPLILGFTCCTLTVECKALQAGQPPQSYQGAP